MKPLRWLGHMLIMALIMVLVLVSAITERLTGESWSIDT